MAHDTEKLVKAIRRRTRKKYSAEEKVRIVLEGMRGEDSIAELCRREGLHQNIYYRNKATIIPGTLRKKFPWKIRSKKNAVCVVCRNRRHLNGWNPFSSSCGQSPLLRQI